MIKKILIIRMEYPLLLLGNKGYLDLLKLNLVCRNYLVSNL